MSQKESIEAKEAREVAKLQKKIKKDGPKRVVDPWIKNFIKSHAKSSPREIYGWLIGRESQKGEIYVFSALACQRYVKQNYIGAAPDPREIQEMGSNIPQGLGMVGIYHSHPAEIFHSSVDDRTLQNMAKMYPKMLSAVTNADEFEDPAKNETRWFQLDKSGMKTDEIAIEYKQIPRKKFFVVSIYGFLDVDVAVPIKGKVAQQVVRLLMNNYQKIWEQGKLEIMKLSSKDKKKIDPWAIKPLQELFSLYNLKTEEERPILSLKDDSMKYFTKHEYILKISLEFSNLDIHKPGETVRIKGIIPLLAVNVFDKDDPDLAMSLILNKIKTEFRDDFVQKLSRCILEIDEPVEDKAGAFLDLHVSNPIFLPYPGIPLKMNLFMEDIKKLEDDVNESINSQLSSIPGLLKTSLQSGAQFLEMESKNLTSLAKRATILATSGNKDIAIELLIRIKEIYKRRVQPKEVQKMETMLSLIKNM